MRKMQIRSDQLLHEAKKNEAGFTDLLEVSSPFEIKGILHSEMLFFVTLMSMLKVTHVIESGRARGNSTELIARYLNEKSDITYFDSIERDAASPDVKVAEKRIEKSGFPVKLHYGDAFDVLPILINQTGGKTIVLIDGPKGIDAVYLGIKAIRANHVVAVCIHDIHKNDVRLRKMVEKYWPNVIASDDEKYSSAFQHLDVECWAEHQKYKEYKNWGPYKRGNRIMKSYGPTLLCFFDIFDDQKYTQAVNVFRKEKFRINSRRKIVRIIGKILPARIKQYSIIRNLARFVY